MREHPLTTTRSADQRLGRSWRTRLGAVTVLAVIGLAAPAPAMAAQTTSANSAADLCARVGARAGFAKGTKLITAVAVGLAESGCSPTAYGVNGPTAGCPHGSIDRGLWQVNSCYHAEVSRACAYDAQCNADAAYRISGAGTSFRPWAAYDNGRYRAHLDEARAAVGRLG